MMFLLDHPGFIDRSLSNTQIKDKGSRTFSTDLEKWKKFSHIYAEDTSRLNLLASVLLVANVALLAIQTVDQPPAGMNHLPEKFSYLSILAALGSIVVGLTVRSPRLFTNVGDSYFRAMKLMLGFPFELFLYSVLFFLLALLARGARNGAVFHFVSFGIFSLVVLGSLVTYWLITEDRNDVDYLLQRHEIAETTATDCPYSS